MIKTERTQIHFLSDGATSSLPSRPWILKSLIGGLNNEGGDSNDNRRKPIGLIISKTILHVRRVAGV